MPCVQGKWRIGTCACVETEQEGRRSDELRQLDATAALLAALQAVAFAETKAGATDGAGLTGALQTLAGAAPP